MSTTRRQEYVTYYSPGTLFAESTSKPIERRDPAMAVRMGGDVEERYAAKPYAFRFETRIVAAPVSDGEGGTLHVSSKTVDETGLYFLGGVLETLDEVTARNDPKESILRSNMRNNGSEIVCVNTNSYRSTMPFGENDCIVDEAGRVTERGDDPRHVAYRRKVRDAIAAEYEDAPPPQSSRPAAPGPSSTCRRGGSTPPGRTCRMRSRTRRGPTASCVPAGAFGFKLCSACQFRMVA